ncbi:MAG: glutathione synthase [Betaproteobacteria bacterium]|nr:glutathione synthase [Betaproteobacteria bacterium]MDH5220640.1 glutathione synthase [Betaproteobacteria bacterium]MDH5349329.1 glutathione synthase [Betaproteobacteria bacterium]
MNLLFIIDPPEELKAYKDTTVTMMRAAERRGHQVHVCTQPALALLGGHVSARATRLHLTDNDEDWYRADGHAERRLAEFDAVLMRKDPPFDLEYVTSTWLLSAAEREGARVFNAPGAIRDHNEKLAIAEFGRFMTPTLATREAARLHAFIDAERDVVIKRLDVMGGENIFRVRADDPNRNVIVEIMTQAGARTVMAQRFIPEIRDGDKRIILIDGKVAPYSLARIPKAGETRGNLAAGARGVAQPLSARDREIAEALGPALAARGLLFVGLDVIGDWLTEVNVTSPTCFREILDQTGYDAGETFIAALEQKVAR